MNSKQIIKKIRTKEFNIKSEISNKFLLKIENYSFEMTYSRIATYTVILDFIEEFLGLNEEVLKIDLINKGLIKADAWEQIEVVILKLKDATALQN